MEPLNSTAVHVSWKLPIPSKQHGQIRGYQVTYVRLENGEPRGPPVIQDVMLAEAQVCHWVGVWGPEASLRCFLLGAQSSCCTHAHQGCPESWYCERLLAASRVGDPRDRMPGHALQPHLPQ